MTLFGKTCLLLSLSLFLLLASCKNTDDPAITNIPDTDTPKNSITDTRIPDTILPETELPETQESVPAPQRPIITQTHFPQIQESICINAVEIKDHPLCYVYKKTDGSILYDEFIPRSIYFVGNTLFYSVNEGNDISVYMYNIQENLLNLAYSHQSYLSQQEYSYLRGNLFKAPCVLENNSLTMQLIEYNIGLQTITIISKIPVNSPRVDIKKLNENEVLFFMYRNIDSKSADTIYKYNVQTEEFQLFYEDYSDDWNNQELTSRNIRLIDSYAENVIILFDQMVERKIRSSIDLYDNNGNYVTTHELYPLDTYGAMQYRINDMYCINNYLFVEYNISSNNPNDYKLLYFNGKDYEQIDISEFEPHNAVSNCRIAERYLLIDSNSEIADLIIIDTLEHRIIPVKFNIDDKYSIPQKCIFSNSEDTIVFIAEDTENNNANKLFTVSISDILNEFNN